MNTPQKILRRTAVTELTGLPKPTIYALIGQGKFPKPVKLGDRAVGWFERDIAAWQASLEKAA